MKRFMRKTPTAVIVLIITLSSGFMGYLFAPMVHNSPNSTFPQSAMIIVILTLIISAVISTPVVYFYRRVIIENHELIEKLKRDSLTGLLNRRTFFDIYVNKIADTNKSNFYNGAYYDRY